MGIAFVILGILTLIPILLWVQFHLEEHNPDVAKWYKYANPFFTYKQVKKKKAEQQRKQNAKQMEQDRERFWSQTKEMCTEGSTTHELIKDLHKKITCCHFVNQIQETFDELARVCPQRSFVQWIGQEIKRLYGLDDLVTGKVNDSILCLEDLKQPLPVENSDVNDLNQQLQQHLRRAAVLAERTEQTQIAWRIRAINEGVGTYNESLETEQTYTPTLQED